MEVNEGLIHRQIMLQPDAHFCLLKDVHKLKARHDQMLKVAFEASRKIDSVYKSSEECIYFTHETFEDWKKSLILR